MKLSAHDAADKGGMLLGIGLREIVGEIAGQREVARFGFLAAAPDPRVVTGNLEGAGVGRLRIAARAEEALAHVEAALAELA